MTAIAHRRMTLEEFLRLRERKPALEYEDGVVTQKVSPKAHHGALQSEVYRLIDWFARPRRLARAFTETRATFGGRSYVPDVIVYRWERVPTDVSGQMAEDFLLPPDIAVEVVSPGQSITKLRERCRWYVANGVQIALLIVPRRRLVYRYDTRSAEQTLTHTDQIDLGAVLPSLVVPVETLFAALRMD